MMQEHIKIRPANGTWVIRAGGAVLGETKRALGLSEGELPPVIYFPKEDFALAFLEPSDTRTSCIHKGEAQHYTIITKSGEIENAAWSYETPIAGLEEIAGYLAFYSNKVSVEAL